ncbi:hypothetical protein FACS189475_06580 [Betaproteobacteria bacterium]|nr:hypothetical protein FACS189475_06580 [Betaproteobacteria bacterium]
MHTSLIINERELEAAQLAGDYLQAIWDKYNALWKAEPGKLMENFSEEQLSFLFYGVLYRQVQNGGFLQLLFNGYAPYIFGSPLADSLKVWGAVPTAELIESIQTSCLQVAGEIKDKASFEDMSVLYVQYPEFENYDKTFYKNTGVSEVKSYVESHLSYFVTVQ